MALDLGWYAAKIFEEEVRLRPELAAFTAANQEERKLQLAAALSERMILFGQERLSDSQFEKYRHFLNDGQSERAFALASEHIEDFAHLLTMDLTDFKRQYLTRGNSNESHSD